MPTFSDDLPLGEKPFPFALPDVVTGTTRSLPEAGRPLLLMFLCRHCPYVQLVLPELRRLERDFGSTVDFVGISSNDASRYPDDGPEGLAEMMRLEGFSFPMLHDASQDVARAYRAVCTPEFFLFDATHRLAYHGQLDESRPKNDAPRDGCDLRAAIAAVLRGEPVPVPQKPAVGCSIKWKE